MKKKKKISFDLTLDQVEYLDKLAAEKKLSRSGFAKLLVLEGAGLAEGETVEESLDNSMVDTPPIDPIPPVVPLPPILPSDARVEFKLPPPVPGSVSLTARSDPKPIQESKVAPGKPAAKTSSGKPVHPCLYLNPEFVPQFPGQCEGTCRSPKQPGRVCFYGPNAARSCLEFKSNRA